MFNKKYKKKIKIVENLIGTPICKYVKCNYNKDLYNFVSTGVISKDMDLKLESNKEKLEGRTKEEFLINMILAWIIEDEIVMRYQNFLDKKGLDLEVGVAGTDKDRELSFRNKVTNESDIFVRNRKTKEIELKIELKADFSGFVSKIKGIDVRTEGSQLNNLKREAKKYRVYILVLDVKNQKISFIEINDTVEYKTIYNTIYKKYVDRLKISNFINYSCLN